MVQEEKLFKDISYLELRQIFCSVEWNHLCNLGRGYHKEQFSEIILNLNQWLRRRHVFKRFLIWSSGDHFVKRNYLCNFGRRHHEEQFCDIILNLGQWFRRRCRLKDFLSGALAALLFSGAEPFMQF